MNPKALHEFLFQLYDYADYLADNILPGNPDNSNYLMSLLYIEDMMDSYGRSLILSSANEAGQDSHKALNDAHKRIDLLRARIQSLFQEYNFDEAVERKTDKLLRDWLHHPN